MVKKIAKKSRKNEAVNKERKSDDIKESLDSLLGALITQVLPEEIFMGLKQAILATFKDEGIKPSPDSARAFLSGFVMAARAFKDFDGDWRSFSMLGAAVIKTTRELSGKSNGGNGK